MLFGWIRPVGLMVTFVLSVSSAIASPTASQGSSSLVRCSVRLTDAADLSVAVSGWGNDGVEALNAAESAAKYLAEMHRMVDGWPEILFADDEATEERRASRNALESIWLTARGDDPIRMPGYSVERGDCENVALPKNKKMNWSATWGGARITGDSPGSTVERVRRRSCGREYQTKRMALANVAEVNGAESRFSGFQSGLRVAYKQLERCYTADAQLELTPGNTRRSAPPPEDSVFVCIGEPPGMDVGGIPVRLATPAGIAGTVEGAAESAWSEWRLLVHRRALALSLEALVKVEADSRLRAMWEAYSHTFEDIGASAKLEDAVTWCWAVPEISRKVWSWNAGTTGRFECAVDEESVQVSNTGIDETQILAQREQLCQESAWRDIEKLPAILSASAPETRDTLFRFGWATTLGCESECLVQSSLGSEGFVPVDLGGFENAKDAWSALHEAIRVGEVGQIAAIIPDIATSNGLELLLVEEQAFVDGLREAVESATLEELFEAREHKGRWTIHMKEQR